MVYQSGSEYKKEPALKTAMKTMPRWKWRLISIGLVIGLIGVGGKAYSMFKGPSAPANAPVARQTTVAPAAPRATPPGEYPTTPPVGSSGFVGGQQPTPSDNSASTPTPDASTPAPDSGYSLLWKALATKIGFSLVVGLIVGVVFRTFLKTAALISVLVVGGAMGISYFFHVNVDMTAVQSDTAQVTGWLSNQGLHLKTALFNTLPSSTSAGIGFLLGLKRK